MLNHWLLPISRQATLDDVGQSQWAECTPADASFSNATACAFTHGHDGADDDMECCVSSREDSGPDWKDISRRTPRYFGCSPVTLRPCGCAATLVTAAAVSKPAASAPAPAPAPAAAATKVSELRGTTVPFTGMQVAVAKNMMESLKASLLHPKGPSARTRSRTICLRAASLA